MSPPLLQLSNVSKSFGAVRALKRVSFDLRPGEVHALLGENGAGKSTLIKVITGAHSPDSGLIHLEGRPIAHLSPALARQSGIACIYQQPALFPDLSVAENIHLRLRQTKAFHRVNWTDATKKAGHLLQLIGANISSEAEISQLSMPEQQLVEIACALGTGAKIIIMDEPTASLTQKEQHILFRVVRNLRSSGAGVVYISHRLDEIFALADRVTVLRDGESVGTNNLDQINETELVRLMVGRDVSSSLPKTERPPGNTVLQLKNVGSKENGIHGINLEVRAGEVLGLAGLVGAGRTELAHLLFGITVSDTGEMLFNQEPVTISSPQKAIDLGIAYVPEDRRRHGIVLNMPITENISMAIHRVLFSKGWLRLNAERQLASRFISNLSIKANGPEALGSTLSGGNQQKIALARWLATRPKLLILDEPTQGIDVGAKSEIHKMIRQFAVDGLAVLIISSDLPELIAVSDRIGVMREKTIAGFFSGQSDSEQIMAVALGQKGAVC